MIKIKVDDNLKSADGKQLKGADLKKAQEKIMEHITNAVAKINSGQAKLSGGEITAINSMNGIEVTNDVSDPGMNTATKVFTIPQQYAGGSLDGLTAAIVHDSFHADQKRRGVKSSGRNAEREASTFAVPILEKLGLNEHIIETYRKDSKEGHLPWRQKKSAPKKKS